MFGRIMSPTAWKAAAGIVVGSIVYRMFLKQFIDKVI